MDKSREQTPAKDPELLGLHPSERQKPPTRRSSQRDWLVPAFVAGSLIPFASIAWRIGRGRLGANPVATALNQVGLLALIFLVASLSCTPLKIAFTWTWPLRVRRALGLAAFFSALLHFSIYWVLDQNFALGSVVKDVIKRPFIAVGFAALVLLVPLALTSTKRSVSRLGFRRWQRLHQLAYVIGVLGVIHFYLRVKADHTLPISYGLVLALGFVLRVAANAKKNRDARLRAELRAARSASA
ncbi:MAG TPA: protein-methionine-sulfoxide reductase heme-binding subunit MsrQ [Polyangiaceae bacterium]|jgi:sulfoxide reductase heme-binding subunit YedZ|nr:protein-methionine-sulfoxide reductase heme-binding subunit MsrQ [Polyangiaceae bacterium]